MRRPNLERYLRKEIIRLARLPRFSIRAAAESAQFGNARTAAPLIIYSVLVGRTAELSSSLSSEELREELQLFDERYGQLDLESIAIADIRPEGMSRDYWKHLHSFSVAWHRPENENKAKDIFRGCIESLKDEKGLVMSEGFKAVGVAPSNGYAFVSGRNSALSYSSASALAQWARKA